MKEQKDRTPEEETIARIVQMTYACINEMKNIPVGVSSRHVHLSREHMNILLGKGATLTVKKMLKQPGQFASEETVRLVGPKGTIENVRVLGPVREETQVEISKSDGFVLGIDAPVTESGKLDGTPGIILEGPCGRVELKKGVMVALRHIHLDPAAAELLQVRDKDMVSVEIPGERGCLMRNVLVRVSHHFASELHVDTDEANAFGLKTGHVIQIQK